jgi:AmiR/NasT family two-component response regulator
MAFTSLVVCPDSEGSQTLARVLNGMEISVEHSATLAEAAGRLAEERFDVVLVDCAEEAAAAELIAALHDDAAPVRTLVVAIVDTRNNVRDIFDRGASFALYKPITAERAASSLRAARGLMRGERRRKRRVPAATQASVSFATVEDASAPLLNLSEEGAAIHSGNKMPPPCKVYLQFALPGQVSVVRLSGEVVWQDFHGRVGLRFAHVPQASRRVLDEWLHTNLARYQSSSAAKAARLLQTSIKVEPAKPARSAPSASERRVQTRQSCRLGAEVSRAGDAAAQRCTLTDLSTGGGYLETTMPYEPGARAEIRVRTQELRLRLRATVQSCDPGFGMGVQFSLKTAEDREQVQRLLASQGLQPVSSAE